MSSGAEAVGTKADAGTGGGKRWFLEAGRRHAWPLLILLALGFVAPLLAVFLFSVAEPRTFDIWQTPTLANYGTIVRETYYISFLWSLVFAALTVIILALICYPIAYGLVRIFGKWSNVVTLGFVIPLFVSENLRLYGWILFFGKGGVLLGSAKALFGLEMDSILFNPPMIVFGMA